MIHAIDRGYYSGALADVLAEGSSAVSVNFLSTCITARHHLLRLLAIFLSF